MKWDEPLSRKIMVFLLLGVWLVSAVFLTMSYWPFSLESYQINTPSPREMVSWYTFTYENIEARETLKKEIEKNAPFYYRVINGAKEKNKKQLAEWLAVAASYRDEKEFENYFREQNFLYTPRIREYILENRFLLARYENRLMFVLDYLQENYILVDRFFPGGAEVFYLSSDRETRILPVSSLLLVPLEKSWLLGVFQQLYGRGNGLLYEAMAEVLLYILRPTAELDANARDRMVIAKVEEKLPREIIRKGETILQEGEVITPEKKQRLHAYWDYQWKIFRYRFPAILIAMMIIFVLFIFRYYKYQEILWRKASFFMIGLIFYTLVHVFLWYAHVSARSFSLPIFLHIPFAVITLTLPILFQQQPVVFVLLINFSLYSVFYPLTDALTFANLLALALFALYTASQKRKSFQKRYDFFVIGMEIFVIQVIFAFLYAWHYQMNFSWYQWFVVGLFCLGNSLISALIAFGILPFFEYVFNIPTYFRLTELSSSSTSVLLSELKDKAPGTYMHSLRLGEMCEMAAEKIGADALLARVGAYYHDVGKLQTPEFFIENQEGENPHDEITPGLSTSVIKSHVKYGVELARQYRLPEEIIAFIEEHHGTTHISYFYTRAIRFYGEETINPADYQYPGPKPSTLETAILMLADGVEATARAYMEKPEVRFNLHTIEDIVDDIIEQRLTSGQLDNCPITLRQIRQIRDVFVEYLSALYHKRKDYHERKEKENVGSRRH
ncbi:HDIG domain-containing metalloprotein [Thermospira aquatica]|uniref:HDIG domain-containing protein n=1 Tax=Thermospira aquatica TaxID=2828656 RepID=A0AAX3BDN8_9SPIR|nr:HDIG domain-containing metalloprotein [Thermospira aquatica]URA10356.1 HDIG domain-containing protein [Thermospira aquatica]